MKIFESVGFRGLKIKILIFFNFGGSYFQKKNLRKQFCSQAHFASFLYLKFSSNFETVGVVLLPANPFFRSKIAEHDVTLTSFLADLS